MSVHFPFPPLVSAAVSILSLASFHFLQEKSWIFFPTASSVLSPQLGPNVTLHNMNRLRYFIGTPFLLFFWLRLKVLSFKGDGRMNACTQRSRVPHDMYTLFILVHTILSTSRFNKAILFILYQTRFYMYYQTQQRHENKKTLVACYIYPYTTRT